MASTYVNNLRLEEIGTGEQSGTWGDTTNTNLELIGQAVAWGERAIANASTDNITIADGALDADRCLGLKLTGGGQACTVTLLPNTSSKTWFMYNATAADLTFTCGSGANVIIPAGQTKVIATDGLGSGGVVHDLLTAVNLAGTTVVDDLTVSDDLTVTDDMTVGGTLGVTGVLTATSLDISGDIDVDGTTNLDVVDIDGAVDMASTLQVDGAITSNGLLTVDGSANSSQAIFTGTSGRGLEISTFSVGAADEGVKLDATASGSTGQITLATNGTNRVVLDGNGDVLFGNGNGHSPKIQGTTNSGRTAGSPGYSFNDDLNTGMFQPLSAADTIAFSTGGTERSRITSAGQVLIGAEASQSVLLSTGHALQLQGTGSNTSSISVTRHSNDTGGAYVNFGKSRGTADGAVTVVAENDILGQIFFSGADGTDIKSAGASIQALVDNTPGSNDMPGRLVFGTTANGAASTTERMRIKSTGSVTISTDGASLTIGGTTAATDANLTLQDPEPAIMFHDSTGGQNDGAIQVENGQMRFLTGANANNVGDLTVKLKLHNGGNLEIDDGDLVIGTSGHGIDFSAGAGGNATSNLLNEYEEGTWTPASPDVTLSGIETSTYTRVGRMVFIQCKFTFPTSSSGTTARVNGLPFSVNGNGTNSQYNISSGEHTFGSYITCPVIPSTTILFRPNGGSSASYATVSGKSFRIAGWYET